MKMHPGIQVIVIALIFVGVSLLATGRFGAVSQTNDISDIKGWDTYKNTQLGFEVSYPGAWETRWIETAEYGKAAFSAFDAVYAFTIQFNDYGDWGMSMSETAPITIAGRSLQRETYEVPNGYVVQARFCEGDCSVLFPHDDSGNSKMEFSLSCESPDHVVADKQSCSDLFDAVVSTFVQLK